VFAPGDYELDDTRFERRLRSIRPLRRQGDGEEDTYTRLEARSSRIASTGRCSASVDDDSIRAVADEVRPGGSAPDRSIRSPEFGARRRRSAPSLLDQIYRGSSRPVRRPRSTRATFGPRSSAAEYAAVLMAIIESRSSEPPSAVSRRDRAGASFSCYSTRRPSAGAAGGLRAMTLATLALAALFPAQAAVAPPKVVPMTVEVRTAPKAGAEVESWAKELRAALGARKEDFRLAKAGEKVEFVVLLDSVGKRPDGTPVLNGPSPSARESRAPSTTGSPTCRRRRRSSPATSAATPTR
jgi:hypothetical protein